jgi:DNA-binding NtrC family response regulator
VATILVMDDDPMVRTVIARILMVQGNRVLEAGSADEALKLCAALGDTLDLLIAEPALPSLSEQQLADRVPHRCPTAKILYISAWPHEIVGWHEGLMRPSAFSQKPFSAPKLLMAVETVLHSPTEGTRTRTAGS